MNAPSIVLAKGRSRLAMINIAAEVARLAELKRIRCVSCGRTFDGWVDGEVLRQYESHDCGVA